jgi:NAD(P)-dependent dehydrogenase (short-subunit alcohol dehydrogenase family)
MSKTHNETKDRTSILITGATGRRGGTGLVAAKELLKLGYAVRTLVRQLDARTELLRELAQKLWSVITPTTAPHSLELTPFTLI